VRAIENGAPLLRACNTGVTAGVDSLGRTIARFENKEGKFELEKGALYVPLYLYSFRTLYTLWGDLFILILSLISLVFLRPKTFSVTGGLSLGRQDLS
jgi:apolipoprotein N-acyltransferase